MRALGGPRLHPGARDRVELALELDGVLGPDGLEATQELVGALASTLVRHTDGVELVLGPAEPQAHVQPPARDDVERGELLGEHDGGVVRHDQHARAQPDARGDGGHEGERDERIHHALEGLGPGLAGQGRVVVLGLDGIEHALEDPEGVIAERLGALGDEDLILRRRPRTGHGKREAELHEGIPSFTSGRGRKRGYPRRGAWAPRGPRSGRPTASPSSA